MKKILLVFSLSIIGFLALGCDITSVDLDQNPDVDSDIIPDVDLPKDFEDRIRVDHQDGCNGFGDYIVIDGECFTNEDLLSPNIEIRDNKRIVNNATNGGEKLDKYIADLSNSQGLGIVSRDIYESQKNSDINTIQYALDLSSTSDDVSENIIVKLTEEGFFEEVSFTDYDGNGVEIKSNPIAFEVFGSFSVIVFDVEFSHHNERDFNQRLWDAYNAGAFYLIHNETGKIFPLFDIVTKEESSTHENSYYDTIVLEAVAGEALTRVVYKDGESTLETLYDQNGNPIIFDKGPIITTIERIPIIEYYEVLVRDDEGEPVLDDEGEPIYELVEEPSLDEDGNQLYEEIEVAELDEEGNPLRMTTFEVSVEVQMIEEVTEVHYWQQIQDGPLSELAQRLLGRIFADYYNWNYYRVSNYQISYNNLIFDKDTIFYQAEVHGSSSHERVVMQLSFDTEDEVIILEEFVNLSRANLDSCNYIFLDPMSNLLICHSHNRSDNLRIYSSTEGLLDVPDSNTFSPVNLPNGQLYFSEDNVFHIEELGYSTTALHKINPDGTLEATLIELGLQLDICRWDGCWGEVDPTFIDKEGNEITFDHERHFHIIYLKGQTYIESANVELISVEIDDTLREPCDQASGCHYETIYELYKDDELYASYRSGSHIYPGEDVPPSVVKYELDDGDTIQYQFTYSNIDKVCDNDDIGCQNHFSLVDSTMVNNNVWVSHNRIIQSGEKFLQRLELKDDTNVEREYIRDFESSICTSDKCERLIPIHFYGEDDELVFKEETWRSYEKGEEIPLRTEKRVTEDTVIERGEICETDSCHYYLELYFSEDTYWGVYSTINKDDVRYEAIRYAEDSVVQIYNETVEREVCLNTNGCDYVNIEYYIKDSNGVTLYEINAGYHPQYGDKAPFSVTVSIDDIEISYEKEHSEDPKSCESDVCSSEHSFFIGDEHLDWGNVMISEGDQFINSIRLAKDKEVLEESDENICTRPNGCWTYTRNGIVQDADGNQLSYSNDHNHMDVFFDFKEVMPNNNDFVAVYELTKIEYKYTRINAHSLKLHSITDTVSITENMFFIDNSGEDWADNYIMYYTEETDRYRGVSTNLISMQETHAFGDGFVGINRGRNAIYYIEINSELSDENMIHFDMTNLTDGHRIEVIENIMISYDGTIYFDAIDNFIQDISGTISPEGEIIIDTTYIEREVIRIRPLN